MLSATRLPMPISGRLRWIFDQTKPVVPGLTGDRWHSIASYVTAARDPRFRGDDGVRLVGRGGSAAASDPRFRGDDAGQTRIGIRT